MLRFIDKLPYSVLIAAALIMLSVPVTPMPHVVEKIMMLKEGRLTALVDIFDLIFHLLPACLLALKFMHNKS